MQSQKTIRNSLKVAVGYSDHTLGLEVAIAAVSLGATIIEKHLTLDKELTGPDHKASLDPIEFKDMVKSIRIVEKSLGDGIKKATKSELGNKEAIRKSIVASKKIYAGDLFTEDNLKTKRPASGISPIRWDDLIGQKAKHSYEPDELIRW